MTFGSCTAHGCVSSLGTRTHKVEKKSYIIISCELLCMVQYIEKINMNTPRHQKQECANKLQSPKIKTLDSSLDGQTMLLATR